MARTLGVLTLDLVLNLAGFKQGMDRAARETERGVKKIESSFKSLGRNIGLLRTGLGALGVGFGFAEIIKATAEAEKSFALLENAVANNAGAAGKTARELADLATELQHVSTFSDEAIQDAERLLLTFQSIRGDNFEKATQATLDLATALGKDLPSAALLVGKALEDPVKGMTQLARAGVVLSPIQQKLVKDFTNAGDAASAQAVILDELNEKYKGTAAAARDNFGGALQGLKNDFDNLLEAKSGLPGATDAINSLAKAMQDPAFASGADAIVSGLLRIGTTAVQAFAGAGQGLVTLADHFTTLKILATQGIDFPVTLDTEEIDEELKRLEARLELQKKTSRLLIPTALEKLETAEIERRIEELRKQKVTITVEFKSLGGTLGFDEPVAKSLSKDRLAELDRILEASKDTSEKVKEQIDILNEALATGLFPGIEGLREYAKAYAHVMEQLDKPPKKPELSEAARAAKTAREAIDSLIEDLEQQATVTGETEEATIRYRIAFGDLVDDFKKAGPAFEERKQQLIDAAIAADKFKANVELDKATEQIREQIVELQAQQIALTQGVAAAEAFRAAHGQLGETLDLATDSLDEYNRKLKERQDAQEALEFQTAVTSIEALIKSTEDETSALIANQIALEQGAVASIRYRIATGDLKDEADALGISLGELQTRLENAAAKQEELLQRQAEDAASESIIPSRAKAIKEYDDAIAGLTRRLQEGEISQKDFDKAVEIAKENFEDATKAIDDMSVFAEQAARNMQDAFADFLFDPFEDGLEGMVNSFAETLRRMAAEIVAAQLAEKFNFEDIFKGGFSGFGGGGGLIGGAGGALSEIAITAQKVPVPGVAAVGAVAGESAAAAAFTAAGTAAAAALTTAGTTAAAAFTTAGTTAATALGTTGTTVASAIIAAGTTAAAAIGAAATAGSAAGGLSEIVITAARLAEGGKVRGPGTAKSDSVPAMLSAGEFVVKAEAVRQPGVERLLTEINNRTTVIKGFATGGPVAAPLMAQAPWSPAKATDEHHRRFDAHTSRRAVEDVHRLIRDERHSTVERLLERTAAPIIVELRQPGSAPLGDLRRSPDDFERLLARLGLLRKAEGGKVFGPGTSTSDSIPAWLSAGEFVVRAEAVRKPGVQELLEKLNARGGVFKGFATGGYVYAPHSSSQVEQHFAAGGLVQASATPTANAAPTIVNQAITVNAPSGHVSRATEMQITAAAARGASIADRRNN